LTLSPLSERLVVSRGSCHELRRKRRR